MSTLKVSFVNLGRQYATLKEPIRELQDKVYGSGVMLDGPYTAEFEKAIALRCRRNYAVAVNSCTQALGFAVDITTPKGERVMIPALSFRATLNAVTQSHRVSFWDTNAKDGLMRLEEILTIRPDRTVIYVDLFGGMHDLRQLSQLSQPVIEDAAQAFGSLYDGVPAGSFGDISCLSFDPMKNLPNYGSGGMLLTDYEHYYTAAKNLRDNGKLRNSSYGTNSKMSELDCAVMLLKLNQFFDAWQKRRTEIAQYYIAHLKPLSYFHKTLSILEHSPMVTPNWSKFILKIEKNRDALKAHLADKGIETRINYEQTLPAILGDKDSYPRAEFFSQTNLALPIYPEMTDNEVEYVTKEVINFLK